MEPFDMDDFEQVDEMLTEASDYSLAGHVVRNCSEAELTKFIADGWAMMRSFADSVADLAMLLERIPTEEMAKGLAPKLLEMSETVLGVIPRASEGE